MKVRRLRRKGRHRAYYLHTLQRKRYYFYSTGTILGVMTSTQTCDLCGGKGKIVKEPVQAAGVSAELKEKQALGLISQQV